MPSKAACRSGKATFRSQGDALRALRRIAIDNAQAVAPLPEQPEFAYACRHCDGWHLTKRNGVRPGTLA